MGRKNAMTHRLRFTVVMGSGRFAHDMLRYDSACPDTEADTHAMEDEHVTLGLRIVVLRRFAIDDRAPTEARWKSQGWAVISDGIDRYDTIERAGKVFQAAKAEVEARRAVAEREARQAEREKGA